MRMRNDRREGRTGWLLRSVAFLALLAAAGCGTATRIKVGGNVHPSDLSWGGALPLPVVLYIEEDLRGYIEVASPTTLHGMNKTYQFNVGAALTPVIEAAMGRVFSDLEIRGKKPTAEELLKSGRVGVLSVGLNSAVIDLQFEPKFVGVNARTNYLIELKVAFDDANGHRVFQGKSRGSGFSTVHMAETEGSSFVPGIDLALQEAVDRLGETVQRSRALQDFAAGRPVPAQPQPSAAPMPTAPAPTTPTVAVPIPTPGVPAPLEPACPPGSAEAAPGRVRQALKLLQVGDVTTAQHELELALCGDPGQEMAVELLRQIQTPAGRLFGNESFPYGVQPGDSLSRIADEFLGDAFQFYALARYNRIDNPSQLQAGQTVRIPVTEHSRKRAEKGDVTPPVVTAIPPGGVFTQSFSVSLQATDDADPGPAIHFTLDGTPPTAGSPRYSAPVTLARTTTLMSVAIDAGGNTSRVRTDTYTLTASRAEAEESYSRGMAALSRGESVEAYQALHRALELDPSQAGARREIEPLRADLVQRYRKEATDAFRQQDLDGAIAGWDKVLEFDPSNRMAVLERARALDLKKKLEQFGSQ